MPEPNMGVRVPDVRHRPDPLEADIEYADLYPQEVLGIGGNATVYAATAPENQREIGERPGEATSLSNLGRLAREQGEYTTAQEYLKESLAI